MTDKEIQEMRDRNLARAQKMKEEMGEKYVLHPNYTERPRNAPSILTQWIRNRETV